jgi:hypothetical protein
VLLQAGVLGSQPSVPVVALTGDNLVCALSGRIASRKVLSESLVAPDLAVRDKSRPAVAAAIYGRFCVRLLLDSMPLLRTRNGGQSYCFIIRGLLGQAKLTQVRRL